MLVLSREKGESIVIGDNIVIQIVKVDRRGRVRLGIMAPDDVSVDRTEVRLAKNRQEGESK